MEDHQVLSVCEGWVLGVPSVGHLKDRSVCLFVLFDHLEYIAIRTDLANVRVVRVFLDLRFY